MTFDFTFSDYDVAQSDGCEAAYSIEYSLFVSSVDVTQSLPAWVTAFDPALPSVTVEFFDLGALGTYSFTVKGELQLNPTPQVSATQIDFTFDVVADPCIFTDVTEPTITDMEFTIKKDALATA